jgi:hypothetical protein
MKYPNLPTSIFYPPVSLCLNVTSVDPLERLHRPNLFRFDTVGFHWRLAFQMLIALESSNLEMRVL